MSELTEAEREALAARIYAERDSLPSRRNRYHPNPLTREDADHLARVILASEYVAAARAADAHAAGVAEGRADFEGQKARTLQWMNSYRLQTDAFRAMYEAVEALADEWERTAPLCSDEEESVRRLLVRELRAALAGTSPQGEGER